MILCNSVCEDRFFLWVELKVLDFFSVGMMYINCWVMPYVVVLKCAK